MHDITFPHPKIGPDAPLEYRTRAMRENIASRAPMMLEAIDGLLDALMHTEWPQKWSGSSISPRVYEAMKAAEASIEGLK